MRRWIRQHILTVRFVTRGSVFTSEHRLFGVRIGRRTYNRVGRWLGRKPNDWRDPDGDIGRI